MRQYVYMTTSLAEKCTEYFSARDKYKNKKLDKQLAQFFNEDAVFPEKLFFTKENILEFCLMLTEIQKCSISCAYSSEKKEMVAVLAREKNISMQLYERFLIYGALYREGDIEVDIESIISFFGLAKHRVKQFVTPYIPGDFENETLKYLSPYFPYSNMVLVAIFLKNYGIYIEPAERKLDREEYCRLFLKDEKRKHIKIMLDPYNENIIKQWNFTNKKIRDVEFYNLMNNFNRYLEENLNGKSK